MVYIYTVPPHVNINQCDSCFKLNPYWSDCWLSQAVAETQMPHPGHQGKKRSGTTACCHPLMDHPSLSIRSLVWCPWHPHAPSGHTDSLHHLHLLNLTWVRVDTGESLHIFCTGKTNLRHITKQKCAKNMYLMQNNNCNLHIQSEIWACLVERDVGKLPGIEENLTVSQIFFNCFLYVLL